MVVQETDLAWLAGIIDSEGCFRIFANSRQDAEKPSISANLTITNSNRLLLNRCREIFDALEIKYLYQDRKNGRPRGRKALRIRIGNYSSLQKIVELTLPFFVGKAEQARLILEFVSLAGERGKLRFEDRSELMNKMNELNRHGRIIA